MFVELCARPWYLQQGTEDQAQRNTEEQLKKLEEIRGVLESKTGEILATLGSDGGRLAEIKGVVLDF